MGQLAAVTVARVVTKKNLQVGLLSFFFEANYWKNFGLSTMQNQIFGIIFKYYWRCS
jgi:hypothetical protein